MIVGLTGGIGSGKSTIANQLRKMGYMVYDTDSEAKRLIVEDSHVRQQIEQLFGSEVYKNGVYQTALVEQRVFADHLLLTKLNAIVHPAVRKDIIQWVQKLPHSTQHYTTLHNDTPCFVECAILYQAGFDALCDKVVVITAPEDMRLARAMKRDCTTREKVRARMRAQEIETDIRRADILINNDGKTSISTLCKEVINQL